MLVITAATHENGVASLLEVRAGRVLLYGLFDVAQDVDLPAVERALRARPADGPGAARGVARLRLERQRDAVVFPNPPVTARLADRTVALGGRDLAVEVYAKVYGFGVMTILWAATVPPGTGFGALESLSVELEQPATKADLQRWMEEDAEVAVQAVREGLEDPGIREVRETLTLYEVTAFARDVTAEELARHPSIPGLLLGEREPFSAQLREDLARASFSYSDRDLVVIGYDQAFVYDPSGASDVANLLEFALAQVLELSHYDGLLDWELAAIHERLGPDRAGRRRSRTRYERLRRELLARHVEFTEVLERVGSAVKVTEDFYYASIYRAAMRVFRADELAAGTQRKLDLIYRTYSMLSDAVDTQTSHRLEWIIIALILFEVVLGLYDRLAR